MLSVMVPVTSRLNIQGYVAVHLPMNQIYQEREVLLGRFYILFLLLFLLFLSVLILVVFTVNRPLKKIIRGAQEYAAARKADPVLCRAAILTARERYWRRYIRHHHVDYDLEF